MSETYGYRIGAVMAMEGFKLHEPIPHGYVRRKYIKDCVRNGKQYSECCNLAMFSLENVKQALKLLKKDYPKQRVRFGKFCQDNLEYLAIQPERPTPPDQWMIIAPVVKE